jgi:PrsW family intramembrane metalloprotease
VASPGAAASRLSNEHGLFRLVRPGTAAGSDSDALISRDMTCDHCGKEGPAGAFCAACGAQQGAPRLGAPTRRYRHYAAQPAEHVLRPGVFTTIFPHLSQWKAHEFRWVFLGGVAGIFALFFAGLITAALCVATLLLPVLYLLYLYEAQVWRDEPLLVWAVLALASVAVGVGITILTNRLVPDDARLSLSVTGGSLATIGVAIPLIQEAAKAVPALALRTRRAFRDETMDGLVFGIVAGIGFGVGETFVRFSGVLTELPVRSTPGSWIYPLLTTAVLLPLLQGAATGLVCAGLWRLALRRVGPLALGAVTAALLGHVAFTTVAQVLVNHGWSQLVILAWQGLVDLVLLVVLRLVLHRALLEEAVSTLRQTYCPHCDLHHVAGGFCPTCGMAMTARPLYIRAASERVGQPRPETT